MLGGIIVPRFGRLYLVAALVAAMCAPLACAWAEGFGTANLPDAEPWQSDTQLLSGEIRLWAGDNQTYALRGLSRVGTDLDAELTLFTMDTSGEDAIAGTVRASRATLIGLNFKWLAHRDERLTVSVIPGVEFPIGDMEGTNTTIPATAISDDIIPVLSVPIQWRSEQGILVTLVPRYIGFDEAPAVGAQTIEGFNDVIAIGAGAWYGRGRFALHADAQVVLEGGNTIDPANNRVTDDLVWSAGGAWSPEAGDWQVDLFATNAAGPTAATSIIATPDQSVGVGVRVSGEF